MTSKEGATVLLAERSFSGHRLAYVRLLAEEALNRKDRVHIALPTQASESAEFKTHLSHLATLVDFSTLDKFSLEDLEAKSRILDAKRTVVTDGDLLALHIGKTGKWLGTGRLSILIMREYAQPHKSRILMWAKNQAKRFIYSRVSSTKGVDMAVLKSSLWTGSSRLRVAVDPVQLQCNLMDVARLRVKWNLDDSIYWFAVLGAITDRKNVPLIVESLTSLATDKVGLLIAGRIDPSLKVQIEASASRLMQTGKSAKIVDMLLSDVDLDAAVTAADCIVLAHSNEGPSGLLGKAAAAGTRVVAAGAASLQEDVLALGGSAQWSPLLVAPLSAALNSALTSPMDSRQVAGTTSSFLEVLLPHD